MALLEAICLFLALVSAASSQAKAQDHSCLHQTVYGSLRGDLAVYLRACDGCCPAIDQHITKAWMLHPLREAHYHGRLLWYNFSNLADLKDGTNFFAFSYNYNCSSSGVSGICDSATSQCVCQQDIQLDLRIADVRLLVESGVLTCASGLGDARDIQVNFSFVSTNGNHRLATCDLNQTTATHIEGWTIYREPYPPYDCVLLVTNATTADAGKYQCIGLLPTNTSGQYLSAASNVVVSVWPLISAEATEDPTLTSNQYFELGILTTSLVMVLVIIAMVVVYLIVYPQTTHKLRQLLDGARRRLLVQCRQPNNGEQRHLLEEEGEGQINGGGRDDGREGGVEDTDGNEGGGTEGEDRGGSERGGDSGAHDEQEGGEQEVEVSYQLSDSPLSSRSSSRSVGPSGLLSEGYTTALLLTDSSSDEEPRSHYTRPKSKISNGSQRGRCDTGKNSQVSSRSRPPGIHITTRNLDKGEEDSSGTSATPPKRRDPRSLDDEDGHTASPITGLGSGASSSSAIFPRSLETVQRSDSDKSGMGSPHGRHDTGKKSNDRSRLTSPRACDNEPGSTESVHDAAGLTSSHSSTSATPPRRHDTGQNCSDDNGRHAALTSSQITGLGSNDSSRAISPRSHDDEDRHAASPITGLGSGDSSRPMTPRSHDDEDRHAASPITGLGSGDSSRPMTPRSLETGQRSDSDKSSIGSMSYRHTGQKSRESSRPPSPRSHETGEISDSDKSSIGSRSYRHTGQKSRESSRPPSARSHETGQRGSDSEESSIGSRSYRHTGQKSRESSRPPSARSHKTGQRGSDSEESSIGSRSYRHTGQKSRESSRPASPSSLETA